MTSNSAAEGCVCMRYPAQPSGHCPGPHLLQEEARKQVTSGEVGVGRCHRGVHFHNGLCSLTRSLVAVLFKI